MCTFVHINFRPRVHFVCPAINFEWRLQKRRPNTSHMSVRWFTRLTNGHSKRLRHQTAMQARFIARYNFGRKHEALKGDTPAMASGLSDHVRTIKELIERVGEA